MVYSLLINMENARGHLLERMIGRTPIYVPLIWRAVSRDRHAIDQASLWSAAGTNEINETVSTLQLRPPRSLRTFETCLAHGKL